MEGGMARSGPSADEATTLLDVLGLVLQHSDLLQRVQDFCHLLETSKAVAAAAQAVPGCLDMELKIRTTQQLDATVPWLAHHGRSIGFLALNMAWFGYEDDDDEEEEDEEEEDPAVRDQRLAAAAEARAAAGAALVAALQQAATAAAAPGLQLRRLDIGMGPSTAVQLLQLAGRQLTRLQLCGYFHEREAAGVATLAAAVAALPGLEQLELQDGTQQLMAGLAGSSSLTQLRVDFPYPSLLPGLPSQLQELTLTAIRVHDGCVLQLRHCTALTRLEGSGFSLGAQDELPDSLVELDVTGRSSYELLLGLKQLRQLKCAPPPAAELRRLSQLSSLSCIKLGYNTDAEVTAATAEAWAVLPGLLELHLSMSAPFGSYVPALQHLSRVTRVDKLSFWATGNAMDAMEVVSRPLAEALPALPQLHYLNFSLDDWSRANWAELSPVLEADMTALAAAIAGLPSLQDLSLSELPWDLFAPPFAAASTQLTRLSLYSGTEVLDVDLSRVFCGLTRLRDLKLFSDAWATDDALVAAAEHLQQLTRLAVHLHPAQELISVTGLQQLTRMPRLQRFELSYVFSCTANYSVADVRAALVAAGGGGAALQLVIDRCQG